MKERNMANRAVCAAWATGAAGLLALLAFTGGARVDAQEGNRFNERQVPPKKTPEDRTGIYMLDFHFKDPRVITVDIPGRGRRLVWYLWYQVSNATAEPRTFNPTFVWVGHDTDTVHKDQVLAKAQLAIQRLEDPDGIFDIKNSQTMTDRPIPVSKEFDEKQQRIAFPKLVTGVAMWDDINPKSTQFSVYVYGLSDGWTAVDGPDGKPIVRRKTLQLKFRRLGDEFSQNSGQIRFQGHEWIYAPADLPPAALLAEIKQAPAEKKEEKKPDGGQPKPEP
jgi:hypothetical protein